MTAEQRYRNALQWIRMVAAMHYAGGAFDPEHMRTLANMAADALNGENELPGFESAMAAAADRGRELAAKLAGNAE